MSDPEQGSPTVDPQRTSSEPGSTGPACPHCGGGPVVPTPVGSVCRSCARVIAP